MKKQITCFNVTSTTKLYVSKEEYNLYLNVKFNITQSRFLQLGIML